jgi:hypothetical protein
MKKVIEFDEQCKDCNGTGLYKGMAERDGAAVVCCTCKGTGCHHFKHTYDEFTGRKSLPGIERVYETNPGICIGKFNGHTLEQFGGMPYEDWDAGKPFPAGSENREFTCPAWWCQRADYSHKPNWNGCNVSLGASFSHCPHFCTKEQCWERWDREIANNPNPGPKPGRSE